MFLFLFSWSFIQQASFMFFFFLVCSNDFLFFIVQCCRFATRWCDVDFGSLWQFAALLVCWEGRLDQRTAKRSQRADYVACIDVQRPASPIVRTRRHSSTLWFASVRLCAHDASARLSSWPQLGKGVTFGRRSLCCGAGSRRRRVHLGRSKRHIAQHIERCSRRSGQRSRVQSDSTPTREWRSSRKTHIVGVTGLSCDYRANEETKFKYKFQI